MNIKVDHLKILDLNLYIRFSHLAMIGRVLTKKVQEKGLMIITAPERKTKIGFPDYSKCLSETHSFFQKVTTL